MIRAHNLLLMKIVRMGQCLRAGAVLCICNHYKWGLCQWLMSLYFISHITGITALNWIPSHARFYHKDSFKLHIFLCVKTAAFFHLCSLCLKDFTSKWKFPDNLLTPMPSKMFMSKGYEVLQMAHFEVK